MSERISRYIAELPPAISGQQGHGATLYAACRLYNGFELTEEETLYWLKQWNSWCVPPWDDEDLVRKVKEAVRLPHKLPRGHLIGGNGTFHREGLPSPKPVEQKPAVDPAVEIQKFLGGDIADETALWELSPVKITGDWTDDGILLLKNVFRPGEWINYVTEFSIYERKSDGVSKANPKGSGRTVERDSLIADFQDGMPVTESGAWLRINPMNDLGVGDQNVTAFRHALIEFDRVPLELQLSFLAKAPLPIAAILTSGGKSIHAWLKIDALDFEDYESKVLRMREVLTRFGIDRNNKNPSRLSRLPGVQRTIGATGDGRQRLLYLNPDCPPLDIEKLERDFAVQVQPAVTAVTLVPNAPDGQNNAPLSDLLPGNEEPWLDGAVTKVTEPLSILTFDQINEVPVDANDQILGDHLLDRGSPLVLAGQGGTGKSRLAFQFIAACIAGHPKFLTFDIHPGARNMRWLMLQTENSVRRLKSERERLKKWLNDEGAWAAFNERVFILTPLKEQDTMMNLDDESNIMRIKQVIETFKPDGIIADPLGDYSTGDLNTDVDMRETIMALSRLARHQNPKRALMILHHSLTGRAGAAKSMGYDRSSFARNSKVLFNWTRAQINIAPMNENDNESLAVSCGKCSDGKEFVPFAITLDTHSLIYSPDESLDVVAWAQDMQGGKSPDIDSKGVQSLCKPAMIKVELAKQIMAECGCSRVSAYRHIRTALQARLIKELDGQLFKT